jgi:integrating conjugative element membrane protein (TIGR03745 family)
MKKVKRTKNSTPSFIKNIDTILHHWRGRFYGVCIGLFSAQVLAQLPTPVDPTSGAPNGNYLAFMQGWTGDAVDYIALAISGAGFLWVGWILLSKFNEARSSNDPDWGSVGLTAVIAGVMLAIVSFFLNEAVGII